MEVLPEEIKEKVLMIIPVFNEQGRIGIVVNELIEMGFNNILVVDDGSDDLSSSEASRAGAKVLRHILNRGAGAATETGLEYFRSSGLHAAVTMDGDGQHFAEDVVKILKSHFEMKSDLTIGDRFSSRENEIPFRRKVYNTIADWVTGGMSFRVVKDSQSGFRVWSRNAAEKISIEQDGFEFCSEVVIKAHHLGLNLNNFPIRVKYTEESMSKGQGFVVGIKTFFNLLHHVLFKVK